jgi:hypothetical protein
LQQTTTPGPDEGGAAYQMIDRTDGTRRPVEERQLLALLAPQLPSPDEAIRLANQGRVVETPAAWFMRTEAPWLKPGPSAGDEAASDIDRESFFVVYGGKFYEITGTAAVHGASVAFSTGLLDLARGDGEPQAAAAHALARGYFTLPKAVANATEDAPAGLSAAVL